MVVLRFWRSKNRMHAGARAAAACNQRARTGVNVSLPRADKDVGIVDICSRAANPDAPRSLICALPGRGGTASDHVDGLKLADYLGATMRHAKRPVRLIAVDGGESYWHPRRLGEDRMRMLIEEAVKPAQRRLRIGRANTGIIGWSMGAYGAMLAAQLYSELFGAVCGVSVAMW